MTELQPDAKLFLMIAIMRDMRADWSYDCEKRANRIKELATELGHSQVVERVDMYLANISNDRDGRLFRAPWHIGGYEGAPLVRPKVVTKKLIEQIREYVHFPDDFYLLLIEVADDN